VLGGSERQLGPCELAHGRGQPGHTLLAGLAARSVGSGHRSLAEREGGGGRPVREEEEEGSGCGGSQPVGCRRGDGAGAG
jgi:hypothetical protein